MIRMRISRFVALLSAVVLLVLPVPATAKDVGVTSLPEFRGPFPDTQNMVFHDQVTPTDMGVLPVEFFAIAKGYVSDVEGWMSPAGERYALVTHTGGIGFVRVTDRDNVQFVGTLPAFIPDPILNVTHVWGDLDTWGNYGYFTREGFGEPFDTDLIIVDLAALDGLGPAAPGTDISGSLTVNLRRPGGYEGAHNIEIDADGFAHLPGVHLEEGVANNACELENQRISAS